jgi:archaemetzincin
MRVCVAALEPVEEGVLDAAGAGLERQLAAEVTRLDALGAPDYAYDRARGQYNSALVLRRLAAERPRSGPKLLAITGRDLFIPMLSFVYGQAVLAGAIAVVSVARLRPEFYGFTANPELMLRRVAKETLHEAGHLCGLVHCADRSCAMALSTNIRQLDLKSGTLCAACAALAGVQQEARATT